MGTPAQNRAAKINADRHRTPRIVRVLSDGGGNIRVQFDRKMDQRFPANVSMKLFDGDSGTFWEFTGNWTWFDEYNLSTDDVTNTGSYTGPTFLVVLNPGNVRAQGRYVLQNRERCERVEPA